MGAGSVGVDERTTGDLVTDTGDAQVGLGPRARMVGRMDFIESRVSNS